MNKDQLILVATANKHKLLELQTVAKRFNRRLIGALEAQKLFNLPNPPLIKEDGNTYHENALKKAVGFFSWSGLPTLGDDSGLEIEILDNRPGVHSARYAGENANDSEKISKVLEEVRTYEKAYGIKNRRAYFCCQLILAISLKITIESFYRLSGRVIDSPRGKNGFGYDPIIIIDELGKTLAEVDFKVTCEKGFRARAAEALFAQL